MKKNLNTFGVKLNISSLKNLESDIKTTLNKFKFDRNKLENFFKSYSIEFNGSAKKASDKIEEILNQD